MIPTTEALVGTAGRPCKHFKLLIAVLVSATCGMSIDRYFVFDHYYLRKSNELATTTSINGEHYCRERDHSDYDACDPRNFLVLVMSGARAKYCERRRIWRESPCPALYASRNVSYRFMLAMPAHKIIDPNGHNQGKFASANETLGMAALRDEYGDTRRRGLPIDEGTCTTISR